MSEALQILETNRREAINFVQRFIHSRSDAEDVVQDVAIEIFENNVDITDGGAMAYVFTMLRRRAIDHQRKLQTHTKHIPASLDEHEHPDAVPLTFDQLHQESLDGCNCPSLKIATAARNDLAHSIIEACPREDIRAVLRLVYIDGHTVAEAAKQCDIGYSAARVGIHRFFNDYRSEQQ